VFYTMSWNTSFLFLFKRFCSDNDIHKTSRINAAELDDVVATAVEMVILCKLLFMYNLYAYL